MKKINPDFVIIGAMKSGSTSLAVTIGGLDDVFMSPNKEPGFFSRDERFELGLASYEVLYEGAEQHQITAEASTCYSRKFEFPNAAERLYRHNPECKLIYLMRNPVVRAYSDYAHRMADWISDPEHPQTPIPYSEALEACPEILDASDYYIQIREYLKYFPADQLHCVIFEELVKEPDVEFKKICEFLGVTMPQEGLSLDRHNPSGSSIARRQSMGKIEQLSGMVPSFLKNAIPESAKLAGRAWLRDVLSKKAQDSAKKHLDSLITPTTPDLDATIYAQLRESIAQLETFLGREINSWSDANAKLREGGS